MTATRRVLIVDDAPAFTRAAAAVVEHTEGFELAGTAPGGEAAIVLLDTLRADLALVDVNMPGIGGLVTAQRMRAVAPSMVVVLVSTYDPADLPADVRTAGVPYLAKARLDPDTLTEVFVAGGGRLEG